MSRAILPIDSADFADAPLRDAPPVTDTIVLARRWREDAAGGFEAHEVFTNVPHLVVSHSPTGYEWGYPGAGPADLALNLVELVLRESGYHGLRRKCYRGTAFQLSVALHLEFKAAVVANWPSLGGDDAPDELHVPFAGVRAWVEAHRPAAEARLAQGPWYRFLDEEASREIGLLSATDLFSWAVPGARLGDNGDVFDGEHRIARLATPEDLERFAA